MPERGRYMISVAAELAGLHPQTLRMYEARGLVRPARTPGGTRLYSELDVPCLPVAVNSGLYWPRRQFLRRPGTIRLEILPPIMPGLDKTTFQHELQNRIETACDRLLAEGRAELGALGLDPLAAPDKS